jgi:hypothetical protein
VVLDSGPWTGYAAFASSVSGRRARDGSRIGGNRSKMKIPVAEERQNSSASSHRLESLDRAFVNILCYFSYKSFPIALCVHEETALFPKCAYRR